MKVQQKNYIISKFPSQVFVLHKIPKASTSFCGVKNTDNNTADVFTLNGQKRTLRTKECLKGLISNIFKADRLALCEIYDLGQNADDENIRAKLFKKYLSSIYDSSSSNDLCNEKLTDETFDLNVSADINKLNTKNIIFVFSLIQDYLSSSNNDEYEQMLGLLDGLSEGIYEDNQEKTESLWTAIFDTTKNYYHKIYLPRKMQETNEKTQKLQHFLNSAFAKKSNNFDIIDEIFNSKNYSLEQKIFLINKLAQPHGYDLCKFLTSQPPNNTLRKQIIDNIADSEKFADENFGEFKNRFVSALRSDNPELQILQKTILANPVIDLILKHTPANFDLNFMDFEQKVDYLRQLPKEEVLKLLEKVRQDWVLDSSINAYETETIKYDLNSRFNDVLSNITVDVDGHKEGIIDIANNTARLISLYGEKIENMQLQTINKITQDDKMLAAELKALSKQLFAVYSLLSSNTQQAKEFQAQIMSELDKIEKKFPQKKQEIKKARSMLEKIKAGLLDPSNITPGLFALSNFARAGSIMMSTGEPTLSSIGALLMGMAFITKPINNVVKEFKKG